MSDAKQEAENQFVLDSLRELFVGATGFSDMVAVMKAGDSCKVVSAGDNPNAMAQLINILFVVADALKPRIQNPELLSVIDQLLAISKKSDQEPSNINLDSSTRH